MSGIAPELRRPPIKDALTRVYAFPENLKSIRTTLSLTQSGLARELGIKPHTVNQWESGKRVDVGLIHYEVVRVWAERLRASSASQQ